MAIQENENSLIKSSFFETMAMLQKEEDLKKADEKKAELIKRAEAKIARIESKKLAKRLDKETKNQRMVALYLKYMFPDAYEKMDFNDLSQKEFPHVLKRAKRYFRSWFCGSITTAAVPAGLMFAIPLSWPGLIAIPLYTTLFITSFLGLIFTISSVKILLTGREPLDWPKLNPMIAK